MPSDHRPPWTALRDTLLSLLAEVRASERAAAHLLATVHAEQRASAVNLLHYLALRRGDYRELQGQLAERGLSSLGRSEPHVLSTLQAVLAVLDRIIGGDASAGTDTSAVARERGRALLQEHNDRLLGPPPTSRRVRIMVTLAWEDADDPARVHTLIRSGMDCARINAAHDDLTAWRAMARNVRAAARALARPCQIAVDLPGPKCRTGALAPGPEVLKLRPQRNALGEVLAPARAWLTCSASAARTPALPVPAAFVASLHPGDKLKLRDARGRVRRWRVASVTDGAAEILSQRTSYVQTGTVVHGPAGKATIDSLPPLESPLVLRVGDTLALTRSATPGSAGVPARIPCEPPELVDMVRVGEAVWLDDGRIGGVITSVAADAFFVRITAAGFAGEKLRAGKGINLPDTAVTIPAFTARDREALAFAAETADIVSLSFIRDPADVHALQDRLTALGRADLGVILKIETRGGFERLPELLLAAMRNPRFGVMIARGDLAVECGFQRLAEVQEEILWLCEAAHVPVVWATQVLETLARTGRPTRAEVTDAAMSERAECVMLNKGPFIAEAVVLLDDILRRMSAHQDKKSAMFRPLRVARLFLRGLDPSPPTDDAP